MAVCVGWSDGFGKEDRDDVIQAEDNKDFAICAKIAVWPSDDMRTDLDFINMPYKEDGEVLDTTVSIIPKEAKSVGRLKQVAEYLLKEYDGMKDLKITDSGLIIEEEEIEEPEDEHIVTDREEVLTDEEKPNYIKKEPVEEIEDKEEVDVEENMKQKLKEANLAKMKADPNMKMTNRYIIDAYDKDNKLVKRIKVHGNSQEIKELMQDVLNENKNVKFVYASRIFINKETKAEIEVILDSYSIEREQPVEEACKTNEAVRKLEPDFDGRKSFYGKAYVDDRGNIKVLYSYETPVAMIKDGEVVLGKATNRGYPYSVWKYSPTTIRHVKEFLKQNGFTADSLKQMEKDYKVDFINEPLVEGPNPGARVTMLDNNEVIIKEVGHSALVKKGDGHYIVRYAPGYFVSSFDAENDEEAIKRFMNESLTEMYDDFVIEDKFIEYMKSKGIKNPKVFDKDGFFIDGVYEKYAQGVADTYLEGDIDWLDGLCNEEKCFRDEDDDLFVREPLLFKVDKETQKKAAFENACDCLKFGYGKDKCNFAGLSKEEADEVWKKAFEYMSKDESLKEEKSDKEIDKQLKRNMKYLKWAKKRDSIDAEADNKKELAKKELEKEIDDADADRDYNKKHLKEKKRKDKIHVNLNAGNPAENMKAFNSMMSVGEGKENHPDCNNIDVKALEWYIKNYEEGDNITVTADLLNVLEQALDMYNKHCKDALKESEEEFEEGLDTLPTFVKFRK